MKGSIAQCAEELIRTQFGDDTWDTVCLYAPRQYPAYYRGINSARDYLLKMGKIHEMVTSSMANARPPKFTFTWLDDNTLAMDYSSPRQLLEIFRGLIVGVGEYFKESLTVSMNGTRATIRFATA